MKKPVPSMLMYISCHAPRHNKDRKFPQMRTVAGETNYLADGGTVAAFVCPKCKTRIYVTLVPS